VLSQFLEGQPVGTGPAPDEIGARLEGFRVLAGKICEDRPEAPSQPVPLETLQRLERSLAVTLGALQGEAPGTDADPGQIEYASWQAQPGWQRN